MDWTKNFLATNIATPPKKLIAGIVTIEHNQTALIKPYSISESAINDLKAYERKGFLKLTNDISGYQQAKSASELDIRKVSTVNGDEHIVFGGSKPIEVNEINVNGKAVDLQSDITSQAKPPKIATADEIEVNKSKARDMLAQHWKKFESDVKKTDDKRFLNLLQIVAVETSAADKKRQIIEDRINEL